MSTSVFRQGAKIEIEGRAFRLLGKTPADVWHAQDVRTQRIEAFTEQQLRNLVAAGKLKTSEGFVAVGEILPASLGLLVIDEIGSFRKPMISSWIDGASGQVLGACVDTEPRKPSDC